MPSRREESEIKSLTARISEGVLETFDHATEAITETIDDKLQAVKRGFSPTNFLKAFLGPVGGLAEMGIDGIRRILTPNPTVSDARNPDEEVDGEERVSESVDALSDDIAEQTDLEEEKLDDLIEAIEEGFEETNEILVDLVEIISRTDPSSQSSETNETNSSILLDSKGNEIHSLIQESSFEQLESTSELIEINGRVVETLEEIESHLRENELDAKYQRYKEEKDRKKLLELTAAKNAASSSSSSSSPKESGGGLMRDIASSIGDVLLGAGGLRAAGKIGGGGVLRGQPTSAKGGILSRVGGALKGRFGAILGLAKVGTAGAAGMMGLNALSGVSPSAIVPTPSLANSVTNVSTTAPSALAPTTAPAPAPLANPATNASNFSKVTSAISGGASKLWGWGSKLLGTPLMLGTSAVEALQTHRNEDLTSAEKTTEYSKIGGKTVGALAGAKAGAAIGAVGGPIGAILGSLVGGIGGYFLGEKGGEIISEAMIDNSESNISGLETTLERDLKSESERPLSITITGSSTSQESTERDLSEAIHVLERDLKSESERPLSITITGSSTSQESTERDLSEAIHVLERERTNLDSSSRNQETILRAIQEGEIRSSEQLSSQELLIDNISPSTSRAEYLNYVSSQIEEASNERNSMEREVQVVTVPINNNVNVSSNAGPQQSERRIAVPAARNQDGTIQRLLDANFIPLMR